MPGGPLGIMRLIRVGILHFSLAFFKKNDSSMSIFAIGIEIILFGSLKLKLWHFNVKLVDMSSSLDHLLLFSISEVLTP